MRLQKGFQAILKTGGGSADCKYLQLLAYLDSFASWLLFISFGTRAQRLTLGIVCLGKNPSIYNIIRWFAGPHNSVYAFTHYLVHSLFGWELRQLV